MKQKHNILVLLTAHNAQNYIEEQINSILNQKNSNIFLLILDDGSTDNTLEIINRLKNNNKNIFIFSKENLGYPQSFYFFYELNLESFFKADYVAFSDHDDIFESNKYDESIKHMENDGSYGLSSSVKCFGSSTKILVQSSNTTKYDYLFEGAGQGCSFVMNAMAFKHFQEFFIQNKKVCNKFYFHDWLIYLFFRCNNYKWKFLKTPLTKYRIHDGNQAGSKYSINGVLNRFIKLSNGWYFNQILYANQISLLIQPSNPNFRNMNLFTMLSFIIFEGRRKISDRLIMLPFFILNFFLRK